MGHYALPRRTLMIPLKWNTKYAMALRAYTTVNTRGLYFMLTVA